MGLSFRTGSTAAPSFAVALLASAAVSFGCGSKSAPAPGLLGDPGPGGDIGVGGGSSGSGSGTGIVATDGGIASGISADASVTTLATLPSVVVGMYAQPGDLLFATSADGIVRSIDPSGTVNTLGGNITRAAQLAANSTAIYVVVASAVGATNGEIVRIDRTSGTQVVIASTLITPGPIALDSSFVYWVDGGTGQGLRLASLPLSDLTTTTIPTTLATYSSFGTPVSLSLSGSTAYFTDLNGVQAELITASLTSASAANFASLLGTVTGSPTGVAVDSNFAYLLTGATGELASFPRLVDAGVTSAATPLVTGQSDAIGLQLIGTEVVWVSSNLGTVLAYDTLTGTSGQLATGFPSATATAVGDAFYVAYANGVIGSVTF